MIMVHGRILIMSHFYSQRSLDRIRIYAILPYFTEGSVQTHYLMASICESKLLLNISLYIR